MKHDDDEELDDDGLISSDDWFWECDYCSDGVDTPLELQDGWLGDGADLLILCPRCRTELDCDFRTTIDGCDIF